MRQLRSRREVLKMSVVAAGAVPVACYRTGNEASGFLPSEQSERYFPQSLASGDPRPDSIVLWTRVEDPSRPREHLSLGLTLALDPEFSELVELSADAQILLATVESDHCVLVQVTGLLPATTYYYRFEYQAHLGYASTRVGRTRTAPAPDSSDAVRFGVVCCQDYNGKYFHVHRQLAEQDVDFVLHLGDYIYESVGDPSFQSPTEERHVTFSEPEQALELAADDASRLVAKSLSNYRDLYKVYRSDPDLQALHERHPVIAVWDDHEFSNDCHGDVATYLDGREDETSPERRAAAEQAWFEYMPVDYSSAPAHKLDPTEPETFAIYRSFVFGQHLELLLTDLRRFRPDHLVPEDAPPGAVYMTQAEVEQELDTLPADTVPYVDLESFQDGVYLEVLRGAAKALAITPEKLTGNTSAVWINQALAGLDDPDLPAAIDLEDAALERGYAYHCLLKSSEFSSIGSRYVVALDPFEALAKKRFRESDGKSELVMGQTQRDWFLETLQASTRTFKVWASGVVFQSRHIDLTGVELVPPELRTRISISAEDWDGFPNERRALLRELAAVGNAVILSGDLHCYFAGTPYFDGEPETRVVELTTSSVSSTTWLDAIEGSLSQDPSLPMGVGLLVQSIDSLLTEKVHRPNPHLAFQELGRNGCSLVEVGGKELSMTLLSISPEDVKTPPSELEGALDEHFTIERLRTRAGGAELEREVEGEFLTWSIDEMEFR